MPHESQPGTQAPPNELVRRAAGNDGLRGLASKPHRPQGRGRAQEPRFAGVMADDDEYYHRQAKAAEEQAQHARNDMDREAWLRVARDWLALVRNKPQRSRNSGSEG